MRKILSWGFIAAFCLLAPAALSQESGKCCGDRLQRVVEKLQACWSDHSEHYPTALSELDFDGNMTCPTSHKPYLYVVSANYRSFGILCEGHYHDNPNYPAASNTTGLRWNSTGTTWAQCSKNVAYLSRLAEQYRTKYKCHPPSLTYLADSAGVHLPSCDPGVGMRAPNETDYGVMNLDEDNFHIFCTSVNHAAEGYRPIQPSYINGLPAEAIFLLEE